MKDSPYYKQAELLLRVLPLVMKEEVFALKGGTAINFFWRNFPRLSVDIDLVYLPVEEREQTFSRLSYHLANIRTRIQGTIPGVKVIQGLSKEYNTITKLNVVSKDAVVKIEPNTVIRGTVYPVVKKSLCIKAEELFEISMEVNTASLEDLYGGKISAALDRQHPRDLYDIKLLFENEGLTEKIKKAFIVYLISHERPIVEVLNPRLHNITQIYNNEFQGMVIEPISLDELITTRQTCINMIKDSLTADEKKFLLSFKDRNPDWKLLGMESIQNLPSVKWKMQNLNRMTSEKHLSALKKLERYLSS